MAATPSRLACSTGGSCRSRPGPAKSAANSVSMMSSMSAWSSTRPRRRRSRMPSQIAQDECQARSQRFRRRNRATARAADRARRGTGAGEQDRPNPFHGRQLFLSAEPAQSHLADAAPAGFRHQAGHVSRRAAKRDATEHAGARRPDHAAADRQRGLKKRHHCARIQQQRARRRLLDAEERRRRHGQSLYAAPGLGEFAQHHHRPPARRRHRGGPRGEPRQGLQSRHRGQDLQRMCALLPVRARRAAGADDRPRGILCGDCQ